MTAVTGKNRIKSTLWRITEPSGKATALGSYKHPLDQTIDIGANPITHAGNSQLGIFYVNFPGNCQMLWIGV